MKGAIVDKSAYYLIKMSIRRESSYLCTRHFFVDPTVSNTLSIPLLLSSSILREAEDLLRCSSDWT